MSDIDRHGLERAVRESLEFLRGAAFVHVSLDLDAVDPMFAPGVGTPVPGGLSYREAHLALELVAESGRLDSLELVEVNPILDRAERDRSRSPSSWPRALSARGSSERGNNAACEDRRARAHPCGWRTPAHDLDWSRQSADCCWRAAAARGRVGRGHRRRRRPAAQVVKAGLEAAAGLLPHGVPRRRRDPEADARRADRSCVTSRRRRDVVVRLEGAGAERFARDATRSSRRSMHDEPASRTRFEVVPRDRMATCSRIILDFAAGASTASRTSRAEPAPAGGR